jgi:hypothetical protein
MGPERRTVNIYILLFVVLLRCVLCIAVAEISADSASVTIACVEFRHLSLLI